MRGNPSPFYAEAYNRPSAMLFAAASSGYYHFRVEVEGVRLFVKVFFENDADEPDVTVISVKRDDR